ncbi:MAG: hypothetical protein ABSF47_00780 [Minisyncoccia bacterium]
MALAYLVRRFFYRIIDFLRHWYIRSAKMYSNFVLDRLARIDRVLAWRVNLKYLFQPLYRDYSVIGYVMGFLLRSLRLAGISVIYLFIFAIAIFVYVVWLLAPIFILSKVLTAN